MRKADFALALALTFAALWLAFIFMTGAGPLWRDEVATVNFATQPSYAEMLAALDFVSLPPAYPSVLRAWLSFGWTNEDFAVRALGFGVTLLTLAGLWLAARVIRIGSPLLLLSLFGIHGAALAIIGAPRPYGLGVLAILAANCAILRLVESPGTRAFAAAVAFATLAVQIQYQNSLFVGVAAMAGLAAAAWSRSLRAAALVSGVAIIAALSLIPYASTLQRSQQWRVLHRNIGAADAASLWQRFVELVSMETSQLAVLLALLVALALVGVVRVLAKPAKHGVYTPRMLFAAFSILGSVVALLGFFFFANRALQPWHVVPAIAVIALAFDVIFSQPLWPAPMRFVITLFVTALALFAAIPLVSVRQTNVDLIAQRLERDANPRDLIVVNPWFIGITLQRYYRGKAQVVTVPPIDDLRFHRIDQVRARMVSQEPLRYAEEAIAATLQGGGRVWVVGHVALPRADRPFQPLPPAPHPESGWSEAAYTIGWSLQLGAYLREHAARVVAYGVPVLRPVNGYETAQLLRAEGWAARGPTSR